MRKKPKQSGADTLEVRTVESRASVAGRGPIRSSTPVPNSSELVNKGNPESIEILYGAYKGSYRVYPVCRWLRLLQGQEYDDLKQSIKEHGQIEPVVINGEDFYDGRNRIRVLNELAMEPLVVEFPTLNSRLSPAEWIIAKNKDRRHLTDDQRLAFAALSFAWVKEHDENHPSGPSTEEPGESAETSRASAIAGGSQPFRQKPAENEPHGKRGRPPGKRSEARALAAETRQSRYRGEQITNLGTVAPDLLEAVARGDLTLREAARKLQERQPANTAQSRDEKRAAKPVPTPLEECVRQAVKWLQSFAAKRYLPDSEREAFMRATIRTLAGELRMSTPLPRPKAGEGSQVVSFRLPKSHFKMLEKAHQKTPIASVNSERGLARKIVRDYLAGRLVYVHDHDRMTDLDTANQD
jgi:hypothetical protein